jgi:hypothetical protein
MNEIEFPGTLRTLQATYIVYAIGLNKEKVEHNSTEWKSVPISYLEEVYLRTTLFLKENASQTLDDKP